MAQSILLHKHGRTEHVRTYTSGWKIRHCKEEIGNWEAFLPHQGLVEMAWIKHGDQYIELYNYQDQKKPFTLPDYFSSLGTKHLCLYVDDKDLATLTAHLESKNVEFWVKHHWPEEATGKLGGVGVI